MAADTPRLVAGTVALEPFAVERISERTVSWLNDPATVRYSELRHSPVDKPACVAYAQGVIESANHMWSIHMGPDGRHVGNITAYIDTHNLVANVAILIGESAARGTGTARAAWSAACEYLLSPRGGMRKVMAGTMAINAPMIALALSCGMQEEGRQKAQFLCEGQEVDLVWFGLFGQRR